jgi:hypothetical protein
MLSKSGTPMEYIFPKALIVVLIMLLATMNGWMSIE